MLLCDQAARSPIPVARSCFSLLVRGAAAGRGRCNRLRDDRAEYPAGRHRDHCGHTHARLPNPGERALRIDGQAQRQDEGGGDQSASPPRRRRGRRPNDGGGVAGALALHRLAAARRLLSRIRPRHGQQARAAHAWDRASQPHGSRSRDSTTSASTATRRRARRSIFRFAAILADLGLPILDQHDAFADALMTAMMYLALTDLKDRNIRIPRQRAKTDHSLRRRVSVQPVDGAKRGS